MTDKKHNEVVLSVDHVSKNFRLPHEKTTSIKSSIVNIFRKKDRTVEVQHALKDISFDIKKGEFFGILGRNGSGKSTLLRILAEIYQPTSGKVSHKGKLVSFIELGVGFNPELTGRENVYLNGALLGFSRKEIDERYDDIVEFAELEEFMDQKLKNYSSGMQVRLAFSVATRAQADILLVDEVLAVGDADFQRKCYDYFKSLKKSGTTVVFVTHDMGAVREYCDRAVLISEGLITHEDKAEKVADEYLKLFNEATEDTDTDEPEEVIIREGDRWGNGKIRFNTIKTTVKNNTLTFRMEIESKQQHTFEDLVIGYRINDAEDQLVAGGNTLNVKGGRRLSMGAGEKKVLTFEMDNIFGSGTYALGATIRSADKVTVYDSWDNATTFVNTKEESYYPVICPATLTIE